MSELTLTKTRIISGVWEGVLSGFDAAEPPLLTYQTGDKALDGLEVSKENDTWFVRAPIPMEQVAEGVHVFVIADEAGTRLAHFTFIAGEALADDIRAEVELLREELDMLKRAFRRHCLETALPED